MAAPLRDNIPTEGPQGSGAYMIGNFDNNRTNAQITLGAKPGGDYRVGEVLGKVTATGIYVPIAPAANDGSQNFAAINWAHRPASAAAQRGAGTVREATINANLLYYENAVTAPQKAAIEAQMAAQGIIPGY